MNMTDVGMFLSVLGVTLGFLAILMSFLWHRNDRAHERCMEQAKTFYSEGNKQDGSSWHNKAEKRLRVGVRIRNIGMLCLYPGYALMLLGFLVLVVGNYRS